MSDIIEGVHPTRMELLKIKDKTEFAVKGHRLLKEKRDSLMMEFMELSRKARKAVDSTRESLDKARADYAAARGVMGSGPVKIAASQPAQNLSVDLRYRNVMGVRLPVVDAGGLPDPVLGYSLFSTAPRLDDAAESYRRALESILVLAEVEGGLRGLMGETKKTKRRVNALEHKRIPQLNATIKYIQLRLDELERENYYRLKMVKKKKEREAG